MHHCTTNTLQYIYGLPLNKFTVECTQPRISYCMLPSMRGHSQLRTYTRRT